MRKSSENQQLKSCVCPTHWGVSQRDALKIVSAPGDCTFSTTYAGEVRIDKLVGISTLERCFAMVLPAPLCYLPKAKTCRLHVGCLGFSWFPGRKGKQQKRVLNHFIQSRPRMAGVKPH